MKIFSQLFYRIEELRMVLFKFRIVKINFLRNKTMKKNRNIKLEILIDGTCTFMYSAWKDLFVYIFPIHLSCYTSISGIVTYFLYASELDVMADRPGVCGDKKIQ